MQNSNLDPGWWRSQTGPAQFVILGGLGLFVIILIWFFVLSAPSDPHPLPSAVGQGQAIALEQLSKVGFHNIDTHDAYGRNRKGDARDWQICFQEPPAGPSVNAKQKVTLGVVPIAETCPSADQGLIHKFHITDLVPDLTGRTAYVISEDFGDDASLRFIDQRRSGHEISGNLGDWKACTQSLPAGSVWNGRPLDVVVAHYEEACMATA